MDKEVLERRKKGMLSPYYKEYQPIDNEIILPARYPTTAEKQHKKPH